MFLLTAKTWGGCAFLFQTTVVAMPVLLSLLVSLRIKMLVFWVSCGTFEVHRKATRQADETRITVIEAGGEPPEEIQREIDIPAQACVFILCSSSVLSLYLLT